MYTGDQTHSSVARAARHLGFRPDQLRVLPTDDDFRLRPKDVIAAIDADLAADRLPFLVSANAGTTNTGAVDPIGELADACHERGVWLHVDGAYGAFAVLTDRGRAAMPGISTAIRSPSIRTSGSRCRSRSAVCSCVKDDCSSAHSNCTPSTSRRGHSRRQFRRPRAAADARQPRDQGLARDRNVRPGCLPGHDRPSHRPDAGGPGPDRGRPAAGARDARVARDPHVQASRGG